MIRHFGWRTLLLALSVWIATAGLLEIGLRLLHLTSLERGIGRCEPSGAHTSLNHAPNVGHAHQWLEPAEKFGQFAGLEYDEVYDEHGIKTSALRPQNGDGTRILFLGDSFVQGYDDANTIPQKVYEWITAHDTAARSLIILNAGYSSYSPLIFTVQAKRLLPSLRPDFVVIDIDETDLFDDTVRYRPLVVRDERGRVVAVDRNPRQVLLEGCRWAENHPLYLVRAIGPLYYQLRLSLLDRWTPKNERYFLVAQTPDSAVTPELREQIQYFSTSLDELFSTLKEYLPADRILVVHHPHLWQLKSDPGQVPWNRKVGELVAAAAARNGISFFDAQDELATRFADHPERYYWNNDMHFNFDGMRAYSELIGRELLRKIEPAK